MSYGYYEFRDEPLCGWDWLHQHGNYVTMADIEAQTIQVSSGTERLPKVSNTKASHKAFREVMNSYKERRR